MTSIHRNWFVLSVLVSLTAARPALEEPQLITQPQPGQEYVFIHSGSSAVSKKIRAAEESILSASNVDFATSHRIPQHDREQVDLEPLEEIEPKFPAKQHQKRDIPPPVLEVEANAADLSMLILPSNTLPLPNSSQGKEQSGNMDVEVAPAGNSGVLLAFSSDQEERLVMNKKSAVTGLFTEERKASATSKNSEDVPEKKTMDQDEQLPGIKVQPVAQTGVALPPLEVQMGDISVPPQKRVIDSVIIPTTTILPLTTAESSYDVIAVNALPTLTKGEVSGILSAAPGDKVLEPAGSAVSQKSRIEVKKGPNGEDYEYEYVYYYYDDEDNATVPASGGGSKPNVLVGAGQLSSSAKPTTTTTSTTTTSTSTTTTTTVTTSAPAPRRLHGQTAKGSSEEDPAAPARTRGRDRRRGHGSTTAVAATTTTTTEEPETIGRTSRLSKLSEGRHRYITIDRHRPTVTEVVPSTAVPETSNEVLPPSRNGVRFRGRTLSNGAVAVSAVPEERLPSSTRFPSRVSASSSTTVPVVETSAPHARAGVRRPSLELVDSRSFRTSASDATPDQDLGQQQGGPAFPSPLPAGPVRFLGVTPEENPEPSQVRFRSRGQSAVVPTAAPALLSDEPLVTITAPVYEEHGSARLRGATASVYENRSVAKSAEVEDEIEMMENPVNQEVLEGSPPALLFMETTEATPTTLDKGAFDLYAILQQAQAVNAINDVATEMEIITESTTDQVSTTDEIESTTTNPTTITTTTATTLPPSTTTSTTTTTTTTITTTTTEAPIKRRGGQKPSRNRLRTTAAPSNAAEVTAAPETISTPRTRGRFGVNRASNGNGNNFGSRRSGGRTTIAPAPAEEPVATREEVSRPSSSGSRQRFSARKRVTTAAPSASSVTSSDDASAIVAATTHLRPAHNTRFASRPRLSRPGVSTTTTASPKEQTHEDRAPSESSSADGSTSSETPSTTGILRPARVRPAVGTGPRPLRPGPRINIAPRGRLGVTHSTSPTIATSTQAPPSSAEGYILDVNEEETSPSTASAEPQEEPAVTTPANPLSRLRNRPRLHVTERTRSGIATAPALSRRPLLPRRRPGSPAFEEPVPTEAAAEAPADEGDSSEGQNGEESKESPTHITPATTPLTNQELPHDRLSSLIAGRRKPVIRRPGGIFSAKASNHSDIA